MTLLSTRNMITSIKQIALYCSVILLSNYMHGVMGECTCTGGTAATGAACIIDGQEQCTSCSAGYESDACDLCDTCVILDVCSDVTADNYISNLPTRNIAPIDNSLCDYNTGDITIGTDIDLDVANNKPSIKTNKRLH